VRALELLPRNIHVRPRVCLIAENGTAYRIKGGKDARNTAHRSVHSGRERGKNVGGGVNRHFEKPERDQKEAVLGGRGEGKKLVTWDFGTVTHGRRKQEAQGMLITRKQGQKKKERRKGVSA